MAIRDNEGLPHDGKPHPLPVSCDLSCDLQMEETGSHIDGIVSYLRHNFVEGKASTAKALILDCVVVAQNRNCIILLDKGSFCECVCVGGSF